MTNPSDDKAKRKAARDALLERHKIEPDVETDEAALMLDLEPQALRRWSCTGDGPIKPVRIGNRLRWKVADIKRLLAGKVTEAA
jgi:Helix-turn-helix domain